MREVASALGASRASSSAARRPPPRSSTAPARTGWRVTRTYGSSETCGGSRLRRRADRRRRSVRIVDGRVELGGPTHRRVLPRRPRAHARRASSSTTARAGTAPTTPASSSTACCASPAVSTTRSSRGGVKVRLGDVERVVREQSGPRRRRRRRRPPPRVGRGPGRRHDRPPRLGMRCVAPSARPSRPRRRPDRIVTVDALPMLPSGKPDRLAIARRWRDRPAAPRISSWPPRRSRPRAGEAPRSAPATLGETRSGRPRRADPRSAAQRQPRGGRRRRRRATGSPAPACAP